MISPSTYIFNEDHSIPYAEMQSGISDSQFYSSSALDFNRTVDIKINTYHNVNSFTVPSSSSNCHIDIYHQYLSVLDIENEFNDLIFPGLRYASEGILIFERPPTHKVVDLSRDFQLSINSDTRQAQYYLPIPWQVYIATYNPATMRLVSVKMFFTSNSLIDFDQEISAPPLYNFYSNGTLCRPFFESLDDIEKYPKTYSGVIASAYDWIWNSGFNFDITENISHFIHSKNFYSFQPFLKTPSAKASFKLLVDNPLNGIPKLLDFLYAKNLYNSWQDIDIKDISSVTWSPFTHSEFYYLEREAIVDQVIDIYLSQNQLAYCTCDCEGCSEYGECCSNSEYVHSYEVQQDPRFIVLMENILTKKQKTLSVAYKDSFLYFQQNKLSMKNIFKNKVLQSFVNMSENLSQKFDITS